VFCYVLDPKLSISDPNPDPTSKVNADPDPTLKVITNPDPTFQVFSDPDPVRIFFVKFFQCFGSGSAWIRMDPH